MKRHSLPTFYSMIPSSLNVQCDQVHSSLSFRHFEKMISDVRHEAVVPHVHLLTGQAGDQLVQNAGRESKLLRLIDLKGWNGILVFQKGIHRCTVIFKFFWGGYLGFWENLGGGPLFSCFIAFLWSNFSKSFEGVHEVHYFLGMGAWFNGLSSL